jgi:hypothetical protein
MKKKIKLALASRDRRQNFDFLKLKHVFLQLNKLPTVAPVASLNKCHLNYAWVFGLTSESCLFEDYSLDCNHECYVTL